jgi:hypothetical protein
LGLALPDLVDVDDSRMGQEGERLGLRPEAADALDMERQPGSEHFQGDDSPRPQLPGLPDETHRAASQRFQDLVTWNGRIRGGIACGHRALAAQRHRW